MLLETALGLFSFEFLLGEQQEFDSSMDCVLFNNYF